MKSEAWREGIIVERKSIENNHKWELVDLPKRKKTNGLRRIFRVKMNSNGTI